MVFTNTSTIVVVNIITIFITFIWVGLSHGPTNKSWLFALCRLAALYQNGAGAFCTRVVPEWFMPGCIVPERYGRWCFMAAFKSFHQKDASSSGGGEVYYTKAVLDLHQKDAGTPTAAQMLTIYTV